MLQWEIRKRDDKEKEREVREVNRARMNEKKWIKHSQTVDLDCDVFFPKSKGSFHPQ